MSHKQNGRGSRTPANCDNLLGRLRAEKASGIKGGIYRKVQVELTYNSNSIEGNSLSQEQTRLIYETRTIVSDKKPLNIDDLLETVNHFSCVDIIIDRAEEELSEELIKKLHLTLKHATADSQKDYFALGEYKNLPNEVGSLTTVEPENVSAAMKRQLKSYNQIGDKSFQDIVEFHYNFEAIHPFQDGNGRIGRLIAFKESLANDIVPFIIDENLKFYYYRGLAQWPKEKGLLLDTCLSAQDQFKKYLDYFRISY